MQSAHSARNWRNNSPRLSRGSGRISLTNNNGSSQSGSTINGRLIREDTNPNFVSTDQKHFSVPRGRGGSGRGVGRARGFIPNFRGTLGGPSRGRGGVSNWTFDDLHFPTQWSLVLFGETFNVEQLTQPLAELSYKLQDSNVILDTKSKVVTTDKTTVGIVRKLSGQVQRFKFHLICGQISLQAQSRLEENLRQTPCIFAQNIDDISSEATCEQLIKIFKDPFNEPDSDTRPMAFKTIEEIARQCETLSDDNTLMKVSAGNSFSLALHVKEFDSFSSAQLAALQLLAKSFGCNINHYREQFMSLMKPFCESKLCTSGILDNLLEINTSDNLNSNESAYRQFLTLTVSIFRHVLITSPRFASQLKHQLFLLKQTLENQKVRQALFDPNLEQLADDFDVVYGVVLKQMNTGVARSKNSNQNTHEPAPPNDFRTLGVFPSCDEILTCENPYLRRNIVRGKYENVEHYLDVQFRLLRADYVEPLRHGIGLITGTVQPDKHHRQELKIYSDITVNPPEMDKRTGEMVHSLLFNVDRLKSVRWEISPRFKNGSLLCLSRDNFRQTIFFATIVDRKTENLQQGQLGVVFEASDHVLRFDQPVYSMVESSSAYFEAYRHVLQALLAIRNEKDMPFPKYFVFCDPKLESPMYLRINNMFDMSSIVKSKARNKPYSFNTLNLDSWPSKEELALDHSQYNALRLALTNELAIIQGPPGTGKTFIGYKIAQTLLANKDCWRGDDANKTPILVVCYTNHALDQFLEGIIPHVNGKMIRIGGRSKCESMERYSMKNIDFSQFSLPAALRHQLHDIKNKKLRAEVNTTLLSQTLSAAEKSTLSYDCLSQVAHRNILTPIVQMDGFKLSKTDMVKNWLVSEQPRRIRFNPVDLDTLHHLMTVSYFPQVVCANALLMSGGDLNGAASIIHYYHRDPRMYQACEALRDMPDLGALNRLMYDYEFGQDDAVFALQQNGNNFELALRWLSNDDEVQIPAGNNQKPEPAVQNEEIGLDLDRLLVDAEERALPIDLGDLENENVVLDDEIGNDNDEKDLLDMLRDASLAHTNIFEEFQGKKTKIQIPEKAWQRIRKTPPFLEQEVAAITDPWKLLLEDRWRLYMFWVEKFTKMTIDRLKTAQETYQQAVRHLREIRSVEHQHLFRDANVIGMTTTGAAKHQATLNAIKPRIVIIEEAAEVLESHIITSLSSGTQHVILIGDHQQLRPNPTVYRLAKQFNLDVSLFERLINNGFTHGVLNQQHRMRPEIADTLMHRFYDKLENHESVYKYPNVMGVAKNMFFFNHDHPESKKGDSTSCENEFEAKMIVGFSIYLLRQGYTADQITILCAYGGQMYRIKTIVRGDKYKGDAALQDIRVTVVDNYQGEESDIVLLSFVRSNNEQKIGFLKTKNRVCVALSRAKIGLFCFGNFDHFANCSPDLWQEIVKDLKSNAFFGSSLRLQCQIHETPSEIRQFDDFERLVPEGGCNQICKFRLDCGHVCRKFCHAYDALHKENRCVEKCTKSCPAGHQCRKSCYAKCGDCTIKVEKLLPCNHKNNIDCCIPIKLATCGHACEKILECGHKCQMPCSPTLHTTYCREKVVHLMDCGHSIEIECGSLKMKDTLVCTQRVEKTLPRCGHSANLPCHIHPAGANCKQPCGVELKCGHLCQGSCSQCHNGRLHIRCQEDCKRILICGHKCESPCSTSCPPCAAQCAMECEHSSCSTTGYGGAKGKQKSGRKCGAPCPPCQEKCTSQCQHRACSKKCCEPCDRQRCNEPCRKILKCQKKNCGMKFDCMGVCGETCINWCPNCDDKKWDEAKQIFLGREDEPGVRFIQLQDCKHVLEVSRMDEYIQDAANADSSSNNEAGDKAINFIRCPRCTTHIFKTNRYRDALRTQIDQIQKVKRKVMGDYLENEARRGQILKKLERLRNTSTNWKMVEASFHQTLTDLINTLSSSEMNDLHAVKIDRLDNFTKFMESLIEMTNRFKENIGEIKTMVNQQAGLPAFLATFLRRWFPMKVDGKKEETFLDILTAKSTLYAHFGKTVVHMANWIDENIKRASIQMIQEASCELMRISIMSNFLLIMFKLIDKSDAKGVEEKYQIMADAELIIRDLFGPVVFSDEMYQKTFKLIEALAKKCNLSGGLGITNKERIEIVQAIGLGAGHWYTCPNDHVYAIGDCGNANQRSQCPECRAEIGGMAHQLATRNATASHLMVPEQMGAGASLADMLLRRDEHLARRLHLQLVGGGEEGDAEVEALQRRLGLLGNAGFGAQQRNNNQPAQRIPFGPFGRIFR